MFSKNNKYMENRNFRWLLQEITLKNPKFNILEVAVCANSEVRETYTKQSDNCFSRKPLQHTKIKYYLNTLLDEHSPRLSEFSPDKLLCIMYFQKAVKLITTQEVLEIPASRIPSMKISSIHTCFFSSSGVLLMKVKALLRKDDALCSCTEIAVTKNYPHLSRVFVNQKAKEFALQLGEIIYKATGGITNKLIFDIVIDGDGLAYFVKSRSILMNNSFKINSPLLKNRKKTIINADFIEMVANTMSRERRANYSRYAPKALSKGHGLDDLINEIEYTRPPVWNRDIQKNKKSSTNEEMTDRKRMVRGKSASIVLYSKFVPKTDRFREMKQHAINRRNSKYSARHTEGSHYRRRSEF